MTLSISVQSIPHREPFLFVDKIVEISDDRIVTTKYIAPDFDVFRGHYPGQPVMPGVLLCECCFQAGALLMANIIGGYDDTVGVPVVTRIKDARFKRMVLPGDMLQVEVTLDNTFDRAYFLTGRASVEGKLALRVEFVCMLAGGKDSE